MMLTSDARSDGHECAECSPALNHHLPDASHKFPPSEAVPVKTKLGSTRFNKIAMQGTAQPTLFHPSLVAKHTNPEMFFTARFFYGNVMYMVCGVRKCRMLICILWAICIIKLISIFN